MWGICDAGVPRRNGKSLEGRVAVGVTEKVTVTYQVTVTFSVNGTKVMGRFRSIPVRRRNGSRVRGSNPRGQRRHIVFQERPTRFVTQWQASPQR